MELVPKDWVELVADFTYPSQKRNFSFTKCAFITNPSFIYAYIYKQNRNQTIPFQMFYRSQVPSYPFQKFSFNTTLPCVFVKAIFHFGIKSLSITDDVKTTNVSSISAALKPLKSRVNISLHRVIDHILRTVFHWAWCLKFRFLLKIKIQ